MKKLGLIMLTLFFFITGCGQAPRLTFMVGGAPNELAYWEEILKDFETETGLKVELLRQAADTEGRQQSINMALRGERPDPDVMMLDVGWIGQMASSDWLLSLNEAGIDTMPFFTSIIELADTHKGKLIGLPVYVDGGMLYYRTDLLEKYGYKKAPETWDDLVKMSLKVQEGERVNNTNFWGYVWQGAQYEGLICDALEVFTSAGGVFFNEAGMPAINSPENVAALQMMADFINKYKISPPNTFTDMKEEEVRQMFQNGNALFERNWPYAWGLHKGDDSAVKGKVGTAPLPHFPGKKSAATLGGWHIAVSKFTDKKEESYKFVKYITSYNVQKKMCMKLGWNPGRMDVYKDADMVKENPNLGNLREILIGAVPRPTVPYYSQMSVVLQKHINAVIAGKAKPKEALDEAQKEVEKVIEEYGRK